MNRTRSAEEDGRSGLAVDLISEDGRIIAREPVKARQLGLPRDETWLAGMRLGLLEDDLDALSMTLVPEECAGDGHVSRYALELRGARGSYRRSFSIHSLLAPIRGLVHNLRQDGLLAADQKVLFSLSAAPGGEGGIAPPQATVKRTTTRLTFETASLEAHRSRSRRWLGPFDHLEELDGRNSHGEEPVPVFVPRGVWEESQAMARRGGDRESAAMWTGRPLRDEGSSELFVVIDAALPAEKADESAYSVTFTGDTWASLHARLEQRREHLGRPHERFCGSVHGHNFGPSTDANGNAMCEACAAAKVCGRTTAAASTGDADWHRAVFAGQPWAVLLVFGFTARQEDDWKLYGLDDGGLARRPVHLLED